MVPVRLRHPRGVTTIEIDPDTHTIDELKVIIFSASEIPPPEQEIKYGYPPKPLPDAEGPLSTIPITRGEQIIVTSVPGTSARPSPAPTPAPSIKALNNAISAPTPLRPQTPLAANDIPSENADSVALPGRDAGFLQLRVVPDDNSCLFSAIGVVFEGGIESAQSLRKVAADAIRNDPDSYPDVVLGQPRETYIRRILSPETWGGAIELAIFAKHYQTEISSFDVATGRCDRFGQDAYDSRCVLVYSGIHYDAVSLSPIEAAPPSFHTTVFPVADQTILLGAETLIAQLKKRHYYTDTATFDLRCKTCGAGLKGEKGARDHAMATNHIDFGEY